MKRVTVLALVLAVLALPGMAQQHRGPAPQPGNGSGVPGFGLFGAAWEGFGFGELDFGAARQALARYLELSPEQMAAWDQLLATLRETVTPLRTQIAAFQDQLHELLGQSNPDPAAVGALVIQIKLLHDQISAARHNYMAGFEGLLTQEQLAKLRVLRAFAAHPGLIPACRLAGLCR